MSIFPSPGSLQHPSWHCWALKPSQVPASPELPCDISKEAFTQENILCSQISLKAGVLATGSCWAWPYQLTLPPLASPCLPRGPAFVLQDAAPLPHDVQQATGPLPEVLSENYLPQKG